MKMIIRPNAVGRNQRASGGHRAYRTAADRNRAIKLLLKRGWNYFVCYRDVVPGHDFALTVGHADWVAPGQCYVNR